MRPVEVICLAAVLAALGASAAGAEDRSAGQAVAVAAFDYSDSSGEVRDQTAEHAARVDLFHSILRDRLTASPAGFRIVDLPCLAQACSAETQTPDSLAEAAKAAGADLLVFGGIHKMSTLVGFGRVDVFDVKEDKLVFDRVISFRGDSDDAFRKAAEFAARDIGRTLGSNDVAVQTPGRGIR